MSSTTGLLYPTRASAPVQPLPDLVQSEWPSGKTTCPEKLAQPGVPAAKPLDPRCCKAVVRLCESQHQGSWNSEHFHSTHYRPCAIEQSDGVLILFASILQVIGISEVANTEQSRKNRTQNLTQVRMKTNESSYQCS